LEKIPNEEKKGDREQGLVADIIRCGDEDPEDEQENLSIAQLNVKLQAEEATNSLLEGLNASSSSILGGLRKKQEEKKQKQQPPSLLEKVRSLFR